MNLGAQFWNASKPFYDSLTLTEHGDPTEQYAARALGLHSSFPNYELFWRYHVCPATERPHGIAFRPGAADIISVIAQRSYTVFVYLVEALEHFAQVRQGEPGPRNRNCYITMMYAGNALQVLTGLRGALCGKPDKEKLVGMRDLASQLGQSLDPLPDFDQQWRQLRGDLILYRNYVTHQGWFSTVMHSATATSLVLKPSAFDAGKTYSWRHAFRDYSANPQNWMPLEELCRLIVEDTVAYLDLAYERIRRELDPHVSNPAYQQLWGWQNGQRLPSGAATRAPTTPSASSPARPLISMTGSTSSAVDPTTQNWKPPPPSTPSGTKTT